MLLKHARQTYKVFLKALQDANSQTCLQTNNEKTSNEDNYNEEWNAVIYGNRRHGVFD
jgi:hypothetical protein